MMWRWATLLLVCLSLVPVRAAADAGPLEGVRSESRGASDGGDEGALQGVRDEAKGRSGKLDAARGQLGRRKSSGGSRSQRSGSHGDGSGVEAAGAVVELVGVIAAAARNRRPRERPSRVRTVGPEEPHHPPGFVRFPYADGASGYMITDRPESERRTFGFNARIGSGFAFGGLYQSSVGAEMQAWRIAVDSELMTFVEPPSPGTAPDALMLGSTSLRVALIMTPFVRIRVGGGGQYLFDWQTDDGRPSSTVGWDLSVDADVFPIRPMVFSMRVDKGMLDGADTTKARGSVGVMIRRFELYADYNLRRIGNVNLHGPGLGLRAWF